MIRALKFRLKGGMNEVKFPGAMTGCPILGFQEGEPRMWVSVDDSKQSETEKFYVALTGESLPEGYTSDYLGMAGKNDNAFVVHLFRLQEKE